MTVERLIVNLFRAMTLPVSSPRRRPRRSASTLPPFPYLAFYVLFIPTFLIPHFPYLSLFTSLTNCTHYVCYSEKRRNFWTNSNPPPLSTLPNSLKLYVAFSLPSASSSFTYSRLIFCAYSRRNAEVTVFTVIALNHALSNSDFSSNSRLHPSSSCQPSSPVTH